MDEKVRRELISGPEASGEPEQRPTRVSDLSEGLEQSFEGVRRLGTSGWAVPANLTRSDAGDAWEIEPTVASSDDISRRSWTKVLLACLGIFMVVALPRLYVLFYVTDPQDPGIFWYGDVFHHWQIGYLSKEIGFSEGFLRLWDFKGLEYFWGLLHPLALAFLFEVTGSVDILIPRLLSVVAGSASLVVLFFLLRRHFNLHVALAGLLLAAFNPVAVFSDQVGMQEPLGLILLLLGLLIWPRNAVWSGLLWALAGMVRAEYWVFGGGLVASGLVLSKESNQRFALAVGWGIPILLYMKYMLSHTGNAIYPIYWNFMAGTAGKWIDERPLTEEQVRVQFAARLVLLATLAAILWLLKRRPRYTLFFMLGLGNIAMLGIVLGLGAYIRGYVTRVLWDRLMAVPYMYVGILLVVGLLYFLPARMKHRRVWMSFAWLGVFATLAASQFAWVPIMDTYWNSHQSWALELELAQDIASNYDGGTLLIPEDRPYLTYLLVRNHGIQAGQLQGQMYDPFAYFTGDPFANWEASRPIVNDWLARDDIRLLVFYTGKWNYEEMIRREPAWFQHLMTAHLDKIEVYAANAN